MAQQVKDSELVIADGKIYHLGLRPGQLAKNVIIVGDPARADKVAAHFDSIEHRAQNREYVSRTGTYKGMPVTVTATGIGTDNTEIALVEMFGLNEFDFKRRARKPKAKRLTIIRVGTCGSLQKDVDVGALAISSYGLGLDSTGLYYEQKAQDDVCLAIEKEAERIITEATPQGRRFKGRIHPYASKASPEVVAALIKHVKGEHAVGITTSAPGFFGPQGREIPGLPVTVPRLQEELAALFVKGLRAINFEMETSLLLHLGALMGYRCGSVCAVVANRPRGTFLTDYSAAVERGIVTALEALRSFS